jgi:uncharacterized membrane protein YfcA
VYPLGLALASLIGLSLGLLGGGGSILTVPVLVYVLGYAAKPAIAMSLPVVGVTSLVGAVIHWRLGNVRLGTAALFGALTMIGAYLGAKGAGFVSGAFQLLLLSVVMVVAAALMFRRAGPLEATADRQPRLGLIVPVAFGVGLLTGVVGIGGGFLVVPALVLLAGVPMRQAVGTSLTVIAMNSVSGFVGYVGSVSIDWAFLARFTALALVGMLVGIAASRRVPQAALKRGFAVFLIITGSFVLYKNRSIFVHVSASAAQATPSLPSR